MLAVNIAVLLTLCAAPAVGQPPAYPPGNYQPGNPQPGYQQSGNPGNATLPPGYRPRIPPKPQPQPAATGSGGTVMYFHKPADALTAAGGSDSPAGSVAQLGTPERSSLPALPDAPASALPPPPPPPQSRYLPPENALPPPPVITVPAVPTGSEAQPEAQPKKDPFGGDQPMPDPYAGRRPQQIPPVPAEYVKLPPRESIFLVYDNLQLEKAIMDRLREDLKRDKKYTPDQERYLVFPPLPIISPPGVPYVAKTTNYPPRQAILEPDYLVHRRLYFEERNAERQGWDLGPLQVLVSSVYFWKDTLFVPNTLASGSVYGFWDTSAGKCQPGGPTPYYLYPQGLTIPGVIAEAGVFTGGSFIFRP